MKVEQIHVGMSESYSNTITDSDIKAFVDISDDKNPEYLNYVYADDSRYKKNAHGLLSSSYFPTIFETKLPSAGCIYVSQKLSFSWPVYMDGTVTATLIGTKVDIKQCRIFFDTVYMVKKKKVITGVAGIYLPEVWSD